MFEGNELWNKADEDLVAQAKDELERLGLVDAGVEAGYVVRMPKAYPVYDEDYTENIVVLRRWLEAERPQRPPRRPQRHAPSTTRTTRCSRPC